MRAAGNETGTSGRTGPWLVRGLLGGLTFHLSLLCLALTLVVAAGGPDLFLEPGTFLAAVLLAPPFGLGVAALGALATLVATARTKRPASRWGFGGWRLLLCPAVVVSGLGLVIARQEAARIPPERRTALATTRAIRTSTDVGRLLSWARDPSAESRREALYRLGALFDNEVRRIPRAARPSGADSATVSSVCAALLQAIRDDDEDVRRAARDSARLLVRTLGGAPLCRGEVGQQLASLVMAEPSAPAAPALPQCDLEALRAANGADWDIRGAELSAIAVACTRSQSRDARAEAVALLGRLDRAETRAVLRERLPHEPDPEIRALLERHLPGPR